MTLNGKYQARCKSGYVMDSTKKHCRRMCSRGELLCADCQTAVVIAGPPVSRWTRFANAVRALGDIFEPAETIYAIVNRDLVPPTKAVRALGDIFEPAETIYAIVNRDLVPPARY